MYGGRSALLWLRHRKWSNAIQVICRIYHKNRFFDSQDEDDPCLPLNRHPSPPHKLLMLISKSDDGRRTLSFAYRRRPPAATVIMSALPFPWEHRVCIAAAGPLGRPAVPREERFRRQGAETATRWAIDEDTSKMDAVRLWRQPRED
ncbi:hypothetical protein HHI36_016365 [Cryptolaemus montrouzieri]|uniref:Uncharacterized protein n=1 Tax=Cryptolaemus montrouzieri TaxID=559131 RepID=A0ABD2NJX7_9CUCU